MRTTHSPSKVAAAIAGALVVVAAAVILATGASIDYLGTALVGAVALAAAVGSLLERA